MDFQTRASIPNSLSLILEKPNTTPTMDSVFVSESFGTLGLSKSDSPVRVEAASPCSLQIKGCSCKTGESILKTGLYGENLSLEERDQIVQPIIHFNVGGKEY
jgi:hypothetical protein